jgi:hypothetical protein
MPRGNPPTCETRHALRLAGRSHARVAPRQRPESTARSCAERLGRRVDRARPERATRRLTTRLRPAQRRPTAGLAARDSRHPRGRAKALLTRLVTWPGGHDRQTVLRPGPPGLGHTWRAGA